MRLTPSDPDIATLIRRIKTDRLDLQPNFQRGEVWGLKKKQTLIDTILRSWHIPPIHVIEPPYEKGQYEVLDGQQRLVAIRDFIDNNFCINGNLAPQSREIQDLGGKYWRDLEGPLNYVRNRIEDFTIRVLTISEFNPGEPGELFFRLNQPTNLTSAEHRNAYFGEARQQVKDLVEYMTETQSISQHNIGFSNSRMAYDDVIAKALLTLELGTLNAKITANKVTERYRDTEGFKQNLIETLRYSIKIFSNCLKDKHGKTKLNKATLYSWLIFISRFDADRNVHRLIDYFNAFEKTKETIQSRKLIPYIPNTFTSQFITSLVNVYNDRSSSRVADISSVKLRDFILWSLFIVLNKEDISSNNSDNKYIRILSHLNNSKSEGITEQDLLDVIADLSWGETLWSV